MLKASKHSFKLEELIFRQAFLSSWIIKCNGALPIPASIFLLQRHWLIGGSTGRLWDCCCRLWVVPQFPWYSRCGAKLAPSYKSDSCRSEGCPSTTENPYFHSESWVCLAHTSLETLQVGILQALLAASNQTRSAVPISCSSMWGNPPSYLSGGMDPVELCSLRTSWKCNILSHRSDTEHASCTRCIQ